MLRVISARSHIVLMVILFLGSLGVLLYNTFATLALPRREREARTSLQSASEQMATEARSLAENLRGKLNPDRDQLDEKLRSISSKVLASFPGLEGGYFVALDNRFSGYAYPTSTHPPSELT